MRTRPDVNAGSGEVPLKRHLVALAEPVEPCDSGVTAITSPGVTTIIVWPLWPNYTCNCLRPNHVCNRVPGAWLRFCLSPAQSTCKVTVASP